MSSRVAGAGLALIAAVLFAVSIATPVALPGPLAMFAGHPTTSDDRTHQAHTITVKDVYAGLLRAELCNTGGDGTCKSADGQLKLSFRLTSYGTLAVTVVAMITAALLAWLTLLRSDRRKGVARTARIISVLGLAGAGLLAAQGPFAEASVPVGLGMALYGLAAIGALIGSFVAVRPPSPIKLRVADRGADQRLPPGTSFDPAMFGDSQLRPLGPPQERKRRDPRPSQPPVAGELQISEAFAPQAQPPSGPHVQVAQSGPRLPPPQSVPPPVPSSGPRVAPPPMPPMPPGFSEPPLFASAPQLRPLYDAAPSHGGTDGLKLDHGGPQPMDSLVGPSASLSVSASQFPFAETKVALAPLQPTPQAPPHWLAETNPSPAGSGDSWTAAEPPTNELPAGWATPEAPTTSAAAPWPPPVAPPVPGPPAPPAGPLSLPPMPWVATAAPAAPAPGMPPLPPFASGASAVSGALPPVPTTLLGAPVPAGPPPVPPARPHRESQQPPPRPGEPRAALRAAVPMPARTNRPTASQTRQPPATVPPPLRSPARTTMSGTAPPPFAIPTIPAIPPVPGAPAPAAPAPASAKRTDTVREPRADSVSDGVVLPDEVGDTTSTTDVSVEGATDPGSGPADLPSDPPAPPHAGTNGAPAPRPASQIPTQTFTVSLPAPPAPSRSIPKLPISTAPDSLPPPKDNQRAATGPSPACPQCEAPMAWVDEHLRFYCKSCRMYF